MASGDTLIVFTPGANEPPAGSYAQLAVRNAHLVIAFDDATAETIRFGGVLPRQYEGRGVTVRLAWMAATATSGAVRWSSAFERHEDDAVDLDADSFATAIEANDTTASASGEVSYVDLAHTDGAEMDSLAAGESFRLEIGRVAAHVDDTLSGDAELLRVEIRET